jgi:streptomycin 6-kinase
MTLYSEQRQQWLKALSVFLKNTEHQLNITIHPPFPHLSHHYVAPATDHRGNELVFKCGEKTLCDEINALKYFNGHGVVQLIQADAKNTWMLLEKCTPGQSIANLEDDQATRIAVQTLQALWQPIDKHQSHFKSVEHWLKKLDQTNTDHSPLPKALLHKAKTLCAELLSSTGGPVLLHGDLHHDNILSTKRQPYLAIDPKGVVGEREYDIGALMRNPLAFIAQPRQLKQRIERRLSIITELTDFDRERLLMWSFVQAILSAIWHEEDGTGGEQAMVTYAEVLSDRLTRN